MFHKHHSRSAFHTHWNNEKNARRMTQSIKTLYLPVQKKYCIFFIVFQYFDNKLPFFCTNINPGSPLSVRCAKLRITQVSERDVSTGTLQVRSQIQPLKMFSRNRFISKKFVFLWQFSFWTSKKSNRDYMSTVVWLRFGSKDAPSAGMYDFGVVDEGNWLEVY